MKHTFCTLIFSLFMLCRSLAGYPEEPPFLADHADILSLAEEAKLTETLRDFKLRKDIEVKVLTIKALSHYSGTPQNFERFATGLFNDWGIGDASRNDGVLFLIAQQNRKMRIELGKGYGNRLDGHMQSVILETIVPEFKKQKYARGVMTGTDEILHVLERINTQKTTSPKKENTASPNIDPSTLQRLPLADQERAVSSYEKEVPIYREKQEEKPKGLLGWLFGGLAAGITALVAFLNSLPKKCTECKVEMNKLSEAQEDDYLNEKQQFEEHLGSVNYNVWECPSCQKVRVQKVNKFFSGYKQCPKCDTKALSSRSETIRRATTRREGLKRIYSDCKYCGHSFTMDRRIPRVEENNSSSSRGFSSGSFGGSSGGSSRGSSSGGGASGSW